MRTVLATTIGVIVGLTGAGTAAQAHGFRHHTDTVQVQHVFSYDGRDLGPAPCYLHPNHPELNVCTLLQPPPG